MQPSDQPIQIHLGKFWPHLEILEVFVKGLELSLSGDFASQRLYLIFEVSVLPFYTPNYPRFHLEIFEG